MSGAEKEKAERSVRPADRDHDADIVPVRVRVWRTAVERVVHVERHEEVLPDLASDSRVQLQTLTARIRQAGIVREAHVHTGPGSIVGVVQSPQYQQPLDIL